MATDGDILTRFVQLYVVKEDLKNKLKPINKEYKQLYDTMLELLMKQPSRSCTYDKFQLSVQTKIKKPQKNNSVIAESYREFQHSHGRENITAEECEAFIEYIKKFCDDRKSEVPDILITSSK